MTRQEASQLLREELLKHGLKDWSIRLNQNPNSGFLGLCSHKDKCIILSAHHIDIHPTPDVVNTIRHEVAHALTPGHGHDEVWSDKAREIGCDNTLPCSTLSLSPQIIDAIRSGADVEVTFEEHVIRTPKYSVTRIQDKCEECGKVAKSVSERLIESGSDTEPDTKIIELECGHTVTKKIPKGTPFHLFQMGGDENCSHTWDKNKCVTCGRARPYEFQLEGMRFLEAALAVNNGGAIFDEMGLGKQIQSSGYLKYHPEMYPVLWILKSGLKYQTAVSNVKWMGTDHVAQVIETSKDWLIPGLKHYIIGYDMLVPKSRTLKSGKVVNSGFDIEQFNRVGIKLVVIDECQQIKNVDSSRTQMVRRVVKGRKVIALSGTPWKNRGSELFPVFNMMDPVKFYSEEKFKHDWVDWYWQGNFRKEGGIRSIPKFKEFTKDICIRRERNDVLKEIPEINRTKFYVKMTIEEETIYDEAVQAFVEWYQAQADEISGMMLIAAMQKMRHLVALAKIPATKEYVAEFAEETERKLIIFAHHQDVQQILYDDIKAAHGEEIPVFRITADIKGQARFEIQEEFNKAPRAFMIASALAAGEGLNLQTCSDVFMHERQWNPANEEQQEGRIQRIGQQAETLNAVYSHMSGLTAIDDKLDEIVERKRRQFHAAMNTGEVQRWNEQAIIKELADSIVAGFYQKKGKKPAA